MLMMKHHYALCIIFYFGFIGLVISDSEEHILQMIIPKLNKSTDTIVPSGNDTKELVNVNCITDKYGTGYVGTQNVTHDGLPCVEWSKNVALYTRYILRKKNVEENYCRNPDSDSAGPWCFIANRSAFKRQFKFKHCGIPLCKLSDQTVERKDEIRMGVRVASNRDCPVGFKRVNWKGRIRNSTFCQVEQDILDKLPSGQYSFQLFNYSSDYKCPEGFKVEEDKNSMKRYCTKTDSSNDLLDFPIYITPKSEELLFITLKLGTNVSCPQMSSKTSLVIRTTFDFIFTNYSTCFYFYKLSNNKISVDRRLAVIVLQRECPLNWRLRPFSSRWKFVIKDTGTSKRHSVYACIPNEDVQKYPEGDYCLLSMITNRSMKTICPEDFMDVTMSFSGVVSSKFCCRQTKLMDNENRNFHEFYNYSSILMMNTANSCPKTGTFKGITIKQYLLEASHLYRVQFECTNCDLFNIFKIYMFNLELKWTYFKVQFQVCNYEKTTNGFAYAALNTRCPSAMKYAYIKYAKERFSSLYNSKVTAVFCTIVNYPKNITFPDGQYCIYKIGYECPPGFQSVHAKLPLYFYKYSDSGGDIPNYQMDIYCCKFGSKEITFENATLPYVTPNFEFGLPYANDSFNCIHGIDTHTAVEDSHMCHYYPITDTASKVSIVFSSHDCGYRSFRYFGPYRLVYSSRTLIRYCFFYVTEKPPPGNYCAPFLKVCPSQYFYYVTYHPLTQRVICCRKPTLNVTLEADFTPSKWTNDVKSFSLLAFKRKCPIFKGYNYGKEPIKRYYYYVASDIGQIHKTNLTEIGIEVTYNLKGFSITMFSCDYKLDPYNKSKIWPHGQYAFPKPLSGCPENFESGNFTHRMETSHPAFGHSDLIHLDGDYMIQGNKIKWAFCVKKDKRVKERLILPYGRYCLMKVEYSCPAGFSEGSVKFVEITALNNVSVNKEGSLPKIDIAGPYITYYFCCQSGRGDVSHNSMHLPTESGPFYLLRYGAYCQKVYGMKFTEEFICIDSEDSSQYLNYTFQAPYVVEGASPVSGSFVAGCDFQINLCYYEKETPIPKTSTEPPTKLLSWPKGSYIFVKPLYRKCPEGFDEGSVTAQTFFQFYPKFMHLMMFGSSDDKKALLSICKRNSNTTDTAKPAENWPLGTYCFIYENKCPKGMLRHKLQSLEKFMITGYFGVNIRGITNLCCKNDKPSPSQLPYFPGNYYSIIIKPSRNLYSCPAHRDTRVALFDLQREIICYYEKRDSDVDFPDGDYLLPVLTTYPNLCLPGFQLVEHRHAHLDGNSMKSLQFCQRKFKSSHEFKFPRGNYCILTTKNECPSSQFTDMNLLTIPMHSFANQKDKFSRYLACCQNDDRIISNLVAQNVPFGLYGNSRCSYVDNMTHVVEKEELTILVQQNMIEKPPYDLEKKSLRVCQYDKVNVWDFGSRCHCHANASCFLTRNYVKCKCLPGFIGDGKNICAKITNTTDKCGNACSSLKSKCTLSASLDSYGCVCRSGYVGNGYSCSPSCISNLCNRFSKCVVDSYTSRCECLPNAARSDSGECYGDLISTIFHIPGFNHLSQIKLQCFSKRAYDHLVLPKADLTLFLFISVTNNMSSSCDSFGDYYGLEKQIFKRDFTFNTLWNFEMKTESGRSVQISNKENVYFVDKLHKPFKRDLFTNAMVFYFNESIEFLSVIPDPPKAMVQFASYATGIMLALVFLIMFVALVGFFIIRKRRNILFGRLYESRSESNVHFIPVDGKLEIDS